MTGSYVYMWLDDPMIGCGWRRLVAVKGRKWVRLLYVPTLTKVKIKKDTYEQAKPIVITDHIPCDILVRIRDQRALHARLGLPEGGLFVASLLGEDTERETQ